MRGTSLERALVAISLTSVAVALVILFGCGGSKKEAPKTEAESTETKPKEETAPGYVVQESPGGTIAGKVLLKGRPLPPRTIAVHQDPEYCGKQREVYPVRVEKGGLVDAVVWIDDIQRGKPFAFPEPDLEQKRCTYVPHIVLMPPGELKISSSDPIPHNVHTYGKSNRDYNESMNQLRRSLTLRFLRPERVGVKCDLHGWMQAYLVVANNPYYVVSREGGVFELKAVPPGHYHLKAWQEALGEMEQEVVVEAGKTTKVDFSFESIASQAQGGAQP